MSDLQSASIWGSGVATERQTPSICQAKPYSGLPNMLLQQDVGDGLEHNCFAPVTDEGLAALLGCKLRPHPDKVAEAAALASVRSPSLKYSLCLPKEILLSETSLPYSI